MNFLDIPITDKLVAIVPYRDGLMAATERGTLWFIEQDLVNSRWIVSKL